MSVSFRNFITYQFSGEFTDVCVFKVAYDMSLIHDLMIAWAYENKLEIVEEYSLSGPSLQYVPAFRIKGNIELPEFGIMTVNEVSSNIVEESTPETTSSEQPKEIKYPELNDVEVTKVEEEKQYKLTEELQEDIDNMIKEDDELCGKLVKSNVELGKTGEEYVYDLILKAFPRFENILVSETSHVADIHSVDVNNKLMFVYEVKNKKGLTVEDINKFDRDLKLLKRCHPNYKVIGIFTSLNVPIPKIGHVGIEFDRCYLSEGYVSIECLKLVIGMYTAIFSKVEKPKEKVNYEIPTSVYKLLSELRSQYVDLTSAQEIYKEQLEMNKKSSSFMMDLLAKTNIQIHFINFINNEFKDVLDNEEAQAELNNMDEERLREYIKSTPRSKITKKYILETYPSISRLRKMKLQEILDEFLSDN